MRTEEEQLAMLGDWWQRHGKSLLTAVVLGIALAASWHAWRTYKNTQVYNASSLYQQLIELSLVSNGQPNLAQAADINNRLQSEFPGTAYAQFSGLFIAKLAVENAKTEDAIAALERILDKPASPALAELARQRLAQVKAAIGQPAEGLKLLEQAPAPAAFASTRATLEGDLLVQLKRPKEARSAYQNALKSLPQNAQTAGIQMKLDDLAIKE